MTNIDRVLRNQCFVEDSAGKWLTNGHQYCRVDAATGGWQVFWIQAEGHGARELRGKAHHPRWLDWDCFGPVEKK